MLPVMTRTQPNARLRALMLGIGGLLLSACQPTYFKVLNSGVQPDISSTRVYDVEHALSLDVYPARNATGPAPVVLFFYGGSWQGGRREYYRFVGEALSARGVVVVIPDYRKAPQVVFPAFMHDAAAATAWTLQHAAELGGDPARVHVMGHSAGGHIAALLGTDARYLAGRNVRTRQIASVIGLAGPYDFLPITDPSIKQAFGPEKDWPQSQPVNFVDGDEPPFLLLHGGSDRRVWPMNSEHLAARLKAHAVPVSLHIIAKTGHIGLVNGFYSPRFSPVLEDTLAWIRRSPEPPAATARATISTE